MKKLTRFSLWAMIIAMCLITIDCSKKDKSEPLGKGMLKLNVGISVSVSNVDNKLKAGVVTDNFHVQIFKGNGEVAEDFDHVSDIPETLELPVGEYYAIASSDNNEPAAFENPYYEGNSGSFTIVTGQTSTASITCKLANIMVSVNYSDNVTGSFTDYSTKVSNATANLVFVKNETRAGYFNSGPLQIEATLNYKVGSETKTKTLTGNIASAEPGKHYEIHIDASKSNEGAIINVALDENVETVVVNINDSPVSGELEAGDLLITEIMYNPANLGDTEGEWIEVFNNSTNSINLKDLVLRRGGTSTFHRIASDVNIAPGTYAVLGRTSDATSNVAYVYSNINLTNDGDEIILNRYGTTGLDGTVICSVNYDLNGFPSSQNGKSIQLDPTVKDVAAARTGSNWCPSTAEFSTGDLGTPGIVNSSCE